MGKVYITSKIQIPERELNYNFARSSGPGGQHVNKSNTKVTLSWSLEANSSIPLELKDYLSRRLATQLTNDGRVTISCDRFRSQDRNKEECLVKLITLLKKGASVPKKRRKTKPTRSSKEKRLKEKKSRSETKQMRKKVY